MNSLFKISCGLFALTLIAIYVSNMEATFLLFTAGVLILPMAVYVDDINKNNNEQ
jgi:hypothetical protein